MSFRFIFERSNRVPTLHSAQLAWSGMASWCQAGGFCLDHCRMFWCFGSGERYLICPGATIVTMFASSNHAVAIQIPIAV
jgi:hypothetical protein